MKTSDFDYQLPKELIAQKPLKARDSSRLMIIERDRPILWDDPNRDGKISDNLFSDLKTALRPGDCLVINDTRVIPARLLGEKEDSKIQVEILLLKRLSFNRWDALVKPGRRLRPGTKVVLGGRLKASVLGHPGGGKRIVEFEDASDFDAILKETGVVPLPPYITEGLDDPERYQTVYSKKESSVAAPTAGLHFTKGLMSELKEMGVLFANVTLDVGLDTFRPIREEDPREHMIHSERFSLEEPAKEIINSTIAKRGRIIAVGTTSVRVLESAVSAQEPGGGHTQVEVKEGETSLFIYPGYQFKVVDGLITNFHLPKSTLLLLVSAFAGSELIKRAYAQAVEERYRFFSFGDAMFII